jgi:hypothetical protein
LPVSLMLSPPHFRRDAGTVPARQEMNIGKQSIDRHLGPRRFHRGARDRAHLCARRGLMSPEDRSDGRRDHCRADRATIR